MQISTHRRFWCKSACKYKIAYAHTLHLCARLEAALHLNGSLGAGTDLYDDDDVEDHVRDV